MQIACPDSEVTAHHCCTSYLLELYHLQAVAYAEICEGGGFGAENTIALSQGFPNWGTFRLLKGYIIKENILI